MTCVTCGSARVIPLNFDQAQLTPPEVRPILQYVTCGERILWPATIAEPKNVAVSRSAVTFATSGGTRF